MSDEDVNMIFPQTEIENGNDENVSFYAETNDGLEVLTYFKRLEKHNILKYWDKWRMQSNIVPFENVIFSFVSLSVCI